MENAWGSRPIPTACATQLLNAGCRITSIQKFLRHKELSTTMIYARVHDQTVEDDYYRAMQRVENRLELLGGLETETQPVTSDDRSRLLVFAQRLAEPELSPEARLGIAAQMFFLLAGREEAVARPP